jgi:hypothetical protein
MSVRTATVVVALIVVMSFPGYGQKTIGRSPSGSLTTGVADTLGLVVPVVPGNVAFDLEFSEPSGNEYLEAKETGRLRIAISNPGSAAVKGVFVRLNALQEVRGVSYPDSIFVGDIPVNSSRYAIFYFKAADQLDPQIVTFGVEVRAGSALLADPKLLTFLTRQR